jgi:hypothetical protein
LVCVSTIIFSASFLFAFVVGNACASPETSSALSNVSDEIDNIDGGYSLSYTITQPEIIVEENCDPSVCDEDESMYGGFQAVSVTTDNPTGYSAFVNLASDETCMRLAGDIANSVSCGNVSNGRKIASVPNVQGGTVTTNVPMNSWGLLDPSAYECYGGVIELCTGVNGLELEDLPWLALPTASSGNAIEFAYTDEEADDHTSLLLYAVKADLEGGDLQGGVYQTKAVYTIAPNVNFSEESWSFNVTPSSQYLPDNSYGFGFTIPTAHVNVDFFRLTNLSYQLYQQVFDCSLVGNGNSSVPPCSYWNDVDLDTDSLYSTGFDYDWNIDWGDGTTETVSGVSSIDSSGITHAYPDANTYTVTISPANPATPTGWLNAFGSSNGALPNGYQNFIAELFEPFPYGAFSVKQGALHGLFSGLTLDCAIPDDLFDNFYAALDDAATLPPDIFDGMFYGTFASVYVSSNIDPDLIVIPENIFANLDTSRGTSFNSTFYDTFTLNGTFMSGSPGSIDAANLVIPENLFANLDTSNALSLRSTFNSTFSGLSFEDPEYTIPENLFASITAPNSVSFASTFLGTFNFNYNFMSDRTVIVPDGLFSNLATDSGEDFTGMFAGLINFGAWGGTADSYIGTVFGDNVFDIDTSNGKKFYGTFAFLSPYTSHLSSSLFAHLDTSSGEDFTGMFVHVSSSYAGANDAGATISDGLLDNIDTSNGKRFYGMFMRAFSGAPYIPSGLFKALDTSQAEPSGTNYIFFATFSSLIDSSSPIYNINDIFVGADLSGIDTPDEQCYGFGHTFSAHPGYPYLTGDATRFINEHIPNPAPSCRNYAFSDQTTLDDWSTLDPLWK